MIYHCFLQVQVQLQQATGSALGVAVTPAAISRSSSRSPTRRSPTKHRPFHLSGSPWKSLPADSAQPGHFQNTPVASSQTAAARKGRAGSTSPNRTAGRSKLSVSPQKRAATSNGRQPKASSPVKGQAEGQADRQGRSGAAREDAAAGQSNPGVMSFGTYQGVSYSSFTPEVPENPSGMTADDNDDDDGESPI